VVFEICDRTDRQTDTDRNTLHLCRGGSEVTDVELDIQNAKWVILLAYPVAVEHTQHNAIIM